MKRILLTLCLIIIITSCEVHPDINTQKDDPFDTIGVKLYLYDKIAEEWQFLSYEEKLSLRQVPVEIMNEMGTRALFLQFIYMDIAKDILLFNSSQRGIRMSICRLNVLQELYKRDDVVQVFLGMLNDSDLEQIKTTNKHFYFFCLQMLSAQKELIEKMDTTEIKQYIEYVSRIVNKMEALSTSDEDWVSIETNYTFAALGYGNIMLKNQYLPFVDLIQSDLEVRTFMEGFSMATEHVYTSICSQMGSYYNQLK